MTLTHDGRQAVSAELLRQHAAVINDARRFAEIPDELLTELPELKSNGPARHFQRMCERFDRSGSLYVMYRRLSGSVHPSLSSVTQYLDLGGDAVTGVVMNPDPEPDLDLLWACGLAAVFAVSGLETLRRGRPYKAKIRKIAVAAGMPPDLSASDTQPELRRPPRAPSGNEGLLHDANPGTDRGGAGCQS